MRCKVLLVKQNFNAMLIIQDAVTPLSESEAVDLVKDVFASATERDIYTV
jgi:20S proteasome subunit beta 6